MDLAEFLLARIAEDEAEVRGALHIGCVEDVSDTDDTMHGATCPRRVLAECEAKRQIVEADARRWTLRKDAPNGLGYGSDPSGRIRVRLGDADELLSPADFNERYCDPAAPSEHVRLLALPYADHPDYREEWPR